MGDKDLAMDQLQISLLKILDKISTYDSSRAAIEAWISRVTINTCLTELRRKKPSLVPIDEGFQSYGLVEPAVLDTMNTGEILKVIETLPDIYREVFNLIEIDGYSHREVAELLDIKETSSRSRLMRSKEMLRNKLSTSKKTESWTNLA